MNYSHRVLWLVTARSGSKSIPDKNIKKLGGLPLLAYRIKSALAFAPKEDVWISTDSKKYAEIAESFGATVPFIRPQKLSTDEAKSEDVALHAMEYAESTGKNYEAICILEPTSPFITPNQLKGAVEKLFNTPEAQCIVAVRKVIPTTFFIQEEDEFLTKLAENFRKRDKWRRQDFKKEITPSGGFYIPKWDFFKKYKKIYTEKTLPYLVPDINALEIDEKLDFLWAEFLIEKEIIAKEELFNLR